MSNQPGRQASKKTMQTLPDVTALGWLNSARRFAAAANHLVDDHPDEFLEDAIYFLYSHALELALKAFLLSHNRPIKKVHDLEKLYRDCRSLRLVLNGRDPLDLVNITSLLEKANENQGLRYFNMKSSWLPDLAWTRAVIEDLLAAVEPFAKAARKHQNQSLAVKLRVKVQKPVPDPAKAVKP